MSNSVPPLPSFDKPWFSIEKQIELLKGRGLVIQNGEDASDFLSHLNYYRFSGYCLAFEESRHRFRDGVTFEDVKSSYIFDVALRDLLSDALEVIEVDSRSIVAHKFGESCNAFGHLDVNNFKPKFDHEKWLKHIREDAKRSKEKFVMHYKAKYSKFPDMPIWIATEVITFGRVSMMFGGLRDEHQNRICHRYSMQKQDFESMLHHFSYVRNLCAHHSRLWDRTWAITPKVPKGEKWRSPLVPDKSRVFVTLLFIYRILRKCSNDLSYANEWRRRVNELMSSPPPVTDALTRMGMNKDWYKHPYWV